VYDTLVGLGPHSVPCLVDRLTDTRWMPDPRMEPLLGVPVVGDVAYMILADKGVPDFLPVLSHKTPSELRMDDYFLWPSIGNHRLRLQNAAKTWLLKHPECCSAPPIARENALPKFRMSTSELARLRTRLSALLPGMSTAKVLNLTGKPDAADGPEDKTNGATLSRSESPGLLGFCAGDHNERLAYIFFTERWTNQIDRRDPLRDRYVILFFTAEGKFTRMFSNVAAISPIFPSTERAWRRLIEGEPVRKKKRSLEGKLTTELLAP
jgi:hypothetical protein